MRYSLWQHGALLGHADLGAASAAPGTPGILSGGLAPVAPIEAIRAVAAAHARVNAAGQALAAAARRAPGPTAGAPASAEQGAAFRALLQDAPEGAEARAAVAAAEALGLELRDAGGARVPTHLITLAALAQFDEAAASFEAADREAVRAAGLGPGPPFVLVTAVLDPAAGYPAPQRAG